MTAAIKFLARLLPDHFRERQRDEWLGDLAQLDRSRRLRYLVTATMTLPSLYAAARKHDGAPYGLRTFIPPKDIGARALIVMFAVVTAMFGAAAIGRLTWTPPPPLMSAAEARQLGDTVFPGRPVVGGPEAPAFTGDADGDTVPGSANFEVPSADPDRDLQADAVLARDRLRSQGWTIDTDVHSELTPDIVDVDMAHDAYWQFAAHREGLALAFTTWRFQARGIAAYEVRRTSVPHFRLLLALAAAVPAALLGWFFACRLHRRADRRTLRGTLRGVTGSVLICGVLPMVALIIAARYAPALGHEPDPPRWYRLFVAGGEHPYWYVVAIAVLALWLGLLPTYRAWQRYEIGPPRPS